jgi:hypothetical protein
MAKKKSNKAPEGNPVPKVPKLRNGANKVRFPNGMTVDFSSKNNETIIRSLAKLYPEFFA